MMLVVLIFLLLALPTRQLGVFPPKTTVTRRAFVSASSALVFLPKQPTFAADGVADVVSPPADALPPPPAGGIADVSSVSSSAPSSPLPPMVPFFDKEEGLFSLSVPKSFYVLRRKDKGDLPDAKGNGRRGATIFTAGNMGTASVIAVERIPVRALLEEAGIDSSGDLTSFSSIGIDAGKMAELLNVRREKEKGNAKARTFVVSQTPAFSDSGGPVSLTFQLRTDIDVQKPELLMEQEGVSELVRFTDAKATVNSKGDMLIIYAGALNQYYQKEEGAMLRESVRTFQIST